MIVRRIERDRLLHPGDERPDALWACSVEVVARRPPAETQPDEAGPVRLARPVGDLSLFTLLVTVGSAGDITALEQSVEIFYPMDDATAERLELVGALTRRR